MTRENQVDNDLNGYYERFLLHWFVNLSSYQDTVYAKVYSQPYYGGLWTYVGTTFSCVVNVNVTGMWLNIFADNDDAQLFNYKIELYKYSDGTLKTTFYPSDDVVGHDISNVPMQTYQSTTPVETFTIYKTWKTDQKDEDENTYYESFRLHWDPDVNYGSESVYAKIYSQPSASGGWTLIGTSPTSKIMGSGSDDCFLDISATNSSPACYDYKIELYKVGADDIKANSSTQDNNLKNIPMQKMPLQVLSFGDAWRTDQIDFDGNGFYESFKLHWNPNVNVGSIAVKALVQSIPVSGGIWHVEGESPLITIKKNNYDDCSMLIPANSFVEKNFNYKITLQTPKEGVQSITLNNTDDNALDNVPMCSMGEQVIQFYDVWRTDSIDVNSDGYFESIKLNWNYIVTFGSAYVYAKIYIEPASGGNWTLIGTSEPVLSTGFSGNDNMIISAPSIIGSIYNFKIELYKLGETVPCHTLEATGDNSDADLGNIPMKVGPPVIESITPDKASAGTKSQVTINGKNFGNPQLDGKVEFTYNRRDDYYDPLNIKGSILNWNDNQIICVVPTEILNKYNASAGSGPVIVITSASDTSNGFLFRVVFGNTGKKYLSSHISFNINESNANCEDAALAVINAANTWTMAGANFSFEFAVLDTSTVDKLDLINEIRWGPLPRRTAANTHITDVDNSIVESDLIFNDSLMWDADLSTGSDKFDVESAALHEFGHFIGLADLYGNINGDMDYDSNKIMFGRMFQGKSKRVLTAGDIAGIKYIYEPGTPETHTISGFVKDALGKPVGSVIYGFPGGQHPMADVNQLGVYIGQVTNNWTGTLHPSQTDYNSLTYSTPIINNLINQNFKPQFEIQILLNSRWNFVSVPFLQDNWKADSIFPGKLGEMFGFSQMEGIYKMVDSLKIGHGYWVYYTNPTTITITGFVSGSSSVTVDNAGWIILGAHNENLHLSQLNVSNGGRIFGEAFRYVPSTNGMGEYQKSVYMYPGEAVWVYIVGASSWPCTVTIP